MVAQANDAAGRGWLGAWWAFALGSGLGLAVLVVSACSMMWGGPGSSGGAGATTAPVEDLYARARVDGEPMIRVRLARGIERARVSGPSTITVRWADRAVALAGPIEVRVGPDAWRVTDGEGRLTRIDRGPKGSGPTDAGERLAISSDGEGLLTVDGMDHAGVLMVHGRRDEGPRAFDLVEHIPAELYLPGVISKELYASWRPETYRAQAIAARSYALHERARRLSRGDHFDLEGSTQDQAYGGVSSRSRAHDAVASTSGVVLTWGGSVLRAYYSSTVGGRAASARDTWPTGPGFEFNLAAPIQASERDSADAFAPLATWEVVRPRDTFTRRLRSFGASRGMELGKLVTLRAIEPVAWNEVGRPSRYGVYGGGGWSCDLSAETLRLACNHDPAGLPPITGKNRVHSGDFRVDLRGDEVVIRGRGFGHGVGMSQFGAEGLARQGWDAERILAHFYPGAELERAY